MKKLVSVTRLFVFLGTVMLAGCQQAHEVDPDAGEVIYTPSYLSDDSSFEVVESGDKDGYKGVQVYHRYFAQSHYYALYSPKGNLEMVVSGCSECGSVSGWKVKYDGGGKVAEVSEIHDTEDDAHFRELQRYDLVSDARLVEELKKFKRFPAPGDQRYVIERNEDGTVGKVGSLSVPFGYKAQYFLADWGPFWSSDLRGGEIGWFVLMEKTDTEGSYVNSLYRNDRLLAEIACQDGAIVEARTFNEKGSLVRSYDRRDWDMMTTTYYDFSAVFP